MSLKDLQLQECNASHWTNRHSHSVTYNEMVGAWISRECTYVPRVLYSLNPNTNPNRKP